MVLPSAYTIFYFLTQGCTPWVGPPPPSHGGKSRISAQNDITPFWGRGVQICPIYFLILRDLPGLRIFFGGWRWERRIFFWKKKTTHVFWGYAPVKKVEESIFEGILRFWQKKFFWATKGGNDGTRERQNVETTECRYFLGPIQKPGFMGPQMLYFWGTSDIEI